MMTEDVIESRRAAYRLRRRAELLRWRVLNEPDAAELPQLLEELNSIEVKIEQQERSAGAPAAGHGVLLDLGAADGGAASSWRGDHWC